MKTTVPLAILFAAVIGGGIWLDASGMGGALSKRHGTSIQHVANSTTTAATVTSSSTQAPGTYTAQQVALHADQISCWTIINGTIYDLTSFISQHPGGEGAILSICGIDGTAAFEAQHGNSRQPNQVLATLKIGTLTP